MKLKHMIIGLVSVLGIGAAVEVTSLRDSSNSFKETKAGSSSYKMVGLVSSLNLTGFDYSKGYIMENGGTDNIAVLKGIELTTGDVFKLTDSSTWLGYNEKDGYGAESNDYYFYYAARNNKLWTGSNLFWKSDDKKCAGVWDWIDSDNYSFVDGGKGEITVQMKTPQYDYSGTYWTTGGATTWIEMNPGAVQWSDASAKKQTTGNVQTWEFNISLESYSSFKFMRGGTSYSSFDDWGAETDSFSCDTLFCSDKNFYVRTTGVYDIYITNNGKVYIESVSDKADYWAKQFLDVTEPICETSGDHYSALSEIWIDESTPVTSGTTYTLAGTFNSWTTDNTYYDLKKVEDEDNVYRFSNIYLTNSDKFKVAVDHSWGEAYPSSDYQITTGEGYYKIEFNSSTKEVTAEKFLYIGNLYDTLSDSAKELIEEGTYTWNITEFTRRYTLIINKYSGLTDFIGGVRSASSGLSLLKIAVSNNGAAPIIVSVIAVISLTAIGGYYFLSKNKKKENQ